MGNLTPANNVIFALIAGLISTGLLHYAKTIGYDVPPDISSGLPVAIAAICAHVWDVFTGDNKIPAVSPPTVGAQLCQNSPMKDSRS